MPRSGINLCNQQKDKKQAAALRYKTKNRMANTYTQLYIQIVFAVKGRANLIKETHREELERYICGVIKNKQSKPLAIYCNPDHIHILIGLHPTISIADMARDIKANSSKWIKQKGWIKARFEWQKGYGAFSYSKSQIDAVAKYILNQPNHHRKKTFQEEYLSLLNKWDIKYEDAYLFEFYN